MVAESLFLSFIVAFLFSCTSDGGERSRQIRFDLADSLVNYPNVTVTVNDIQDSNLVLDTAFDGKINNPGSVPLYRVPDSIRADFRIRIQAFDSSGLLVLQSDIVVKSGSASTSVKTPPDKLPGVIASRPTARLAGLDISAGALDPAFKPGIFSYSVHVPYESNSLSINATAADTQSTLTLDGGVLVSGTPSVGKILKTGEQFIKVGVLPKGGSLANFYVLKVRRDAADEVRLDSLRISAGQSTLIFHPDSVNLVAEVTDEIETLVVRPFVRDRKAKLEVDGVLTDTSFGKVVDLKPETTTIIVIKVTSRDSSKTKTYFLKVLRRPSTDAALSGLSVQAATLVPPFDPEVEKYSSMLTSDLVSIIPKVRKVGAKITVNGKDVISDQISQLIAVTVGSTPVSIVVIAPDRKTKKTYTLILNKINPAVYLDGISLTGATLDSTFLQTRFHYTSNVNRDVGNVIVNAQTGDQPISVSGSLNGAPVTAGAAFTAAGIRYVPFTFALKVGLNTIALETAGPDNVSKCVYSIDLTRLPSTNTDLAELSFGTSILVPVFLASTTKYTDTLSALSFITTVKAKPVDTAGASLVIRLKRPSPGTTPQKFVTISTDTLAPGKFIKTLPLEPRSNIFEVEVTAENRTSRKTYTTEVWKKLNTIFQLKTLVVNAGQYGLVALSPEFSSAQAAYSASTKSGYVTVTPTILLPGTKVSINGYAVESGVASESITLLKGLNKITVHCIAENDSTNGDYILNVTRTSP